VWSERVFGHNGSLQDEVPLIERPFVARMLQKKSIQDF
jgi:hypothetical protein